MLDPRRLSGFLAQLMLVAEGGLDLVGRGRHDEPQPHGEDPHEHRVVEHDADAAWDAELGEPVDPGAKRGGEDDRAEQERDDEPRLPDDQGGDEDPGHHKGRDRHASREAREPAPVHSAIRRAGFELVHRRLSRRHR